MGHNLSDAEDSLSNMELPSSDLLDLFMKLLSGFLEKCRDESVEAVWLDVRENNDVARAFYERAGFEAFEVRRNFYTDPPDSGIVMQLAIAKDQIKFL